MAGRPASQKVRIRGRKSSREYCRLLYSLPLVFDRVSCSFKSRSSHMLCTPIRTFDGGLVGIAGCKSNDLNDVGRSCGRILLTAGKLSILIFILAR